MQALRHPHGELPSPRWVARRSRVGAPSSSVRPPAWDRCSCGRSAPSAGARRHGHAASAWPSSPGTSRGPRAGCCARRGASTCSACAAPTRRAGASRCACAVAAGPGARGWCSPSTATTRPDTGTGERASDPVWAGGCDELQLRTSRPLRGALRVHFVSVPPRPPVARRARGGQPQAAGRARPGRADDHPPRRVGGRRRAAARGARLRRGADGLRPSHRHRQRLHARPVGLDGARDRQVPPRHQRLERHRLQLPRRPVRAGLRRARGRGRAGGHRRPRAGLQLAVHRRRGARHLHRRRRSPKPRWRRSPSCSAGSSRCTACRARAG